MNQIVSKIYVFTNNCEEVFKYSEKNICSKTEINHFHEELSLLGIIYVENFTMKIYLTQRNGNIS